MGKDGYASPDDGRRRKKAGARFGSIRLPSWALGAIGFIGLVVLAGLLTMIALGVVAFSRSQDAREGGGDFLASVQSACLPNSTIWIATTVDGYEDRSDIVNITTLLVERVGDLVSVTAQFPLPFPGWFDADDIRNPGDIFFLVDSRCVPPSSGFLPCSDLCRQGIDPSIGDALVDYTIEDYFIQYGQDYVLSVELAKPTPSITDGWVPIQTSPDLGDTVFYGINPQITSGNSTSGTVGVRLYTFTLTYYTNASSGWTIPDICKGTLCQTSDFFPDTDIA
jgi:hypothetical protein